MTSYRPMEMNRTRSYFITGGAGFIGSHFTDRLLASDDVSEVTLFDNFSSGREWHFEHHLARGDTRLHVIRGDLNDLVTLTNAMAGHDIVIHLASNPDIARAATEPEIDFHQGTALTNNVVEAMRRAGVGHLLYASGSGVYGDMGDTPLSEDHGPLIPVSTYGASKLAGEALIAAYCAMFALTACAFRFGNVVGARQTHGVGFDFVRRLRTNPAQLRILGDGRQSKTYVHVSDVIDAVITASQQVGTGFAAFNVGTGDAITVTEIAEIAVESLEIPNKPAFAYTGGDRGWKGDVPVVRLNTGKLRSLGWQPRLTSREAIYQSLKELIRDERTFIQ
ncbi:MAG TPA: NAD-dependent epimerase/dehydratase family protein [Silvibacterium sp.]|nr:NAD-dependent epimerase/dehydratase family protein [Silvibacterium sp.]